MKNIDKVAEFNDKMREFDKCNSFLCSFLCILYKHLNACLRVSVKIV